MSENKRIVAMVMVDPQGNYDEWGDFCQDWVIARTMPQWTEVTEEEYKVLKFYCTSMRKKATSDEYPVLIEQVHPDEVHLIIENQLEKARAFWKEKEDEQARKDARQAQAWLAAEAKKKQEEAKEIERAKALLESKGLQVK